MKDKVKARERERERKKEASARKWCKPCVSLSVSSSAFEWHRLFAYRPVLLFLRLFLSASYTVSCHLTHTTLGINKEGNSTQRTSRTQVVEQKNRTISFSRFSLISIKRGNECFLRERQEDNLVKDLNREGILISKQQLCIESSGKVI